MSLTLEMLEKKETSLKEPKSLQELKIKEIGGQKNSCLTMNHHFEYSRTRTYYHRRCKSRKTNGLFMTNILSLPTEMVFNILLQLPAQDIYEVVRFVCWKWYHMIRTRDFVYEHLKQQSTVSAGLLIYGGWIVDSVRGKGRPLTYVSMRQHGCDRSVEISNVSCIYTNMVWSSCNGLLLLVDRAKWIATNCESVVYYILNPLTKQCFSLPKFFRPAICRYWRAGLGYAAASMEYKVVVIYKDEGANNNREYYELNCAIFTVGVDKSWRCINTHHLSTTRLLNATPLVSQGFLHWYDYGTSGLVVTLNIETETLKEFRVPQGYERKWKKYLSTGTSYLSFVLMSKSKLSWEVWEMKPETGEWTKLANIDLEAKRKHLFTEHGCSSLEPIGWLKYKEVMLFFIEQRRSFRFIAYDACTQKIYPIELGYYLSRCIPHVKSLVCLDG